MRLLHRKALTCAAVLYAAGIGQAAAQGGMQTVEQINACMAKNFVNRGALRDITLTPTDREGKMRTLKLRFFWKPTKGGAPRINLQLMEPLAMAGSGYLLLVKGGQEEVHFYFPGADRALHVTGKNMSEPLWGTDVSYGEIKQVLGLLASGPTQRLADANIGGRGAYALQTVTKAHETGYQQVISYVDHQACVLLRSEFYAKPDKPRKVLEADVSSLLNADQYWLVLAYTMQDVLRGTKTKVDLSDFSLLENIPERMFDPKRFFEPYQ